MQRRAKKQKSPPPVYERAVALAARRLRSAAELTKKLLAEGYDEEKVEAAISRLREVHLLDDNLYAQSVSRRYADRGDRFIARKLREKGVAAEQESVLGGLSAELERALQAGHKKLRTLGNKEPRVLAQKLWQHLASRGFSGNTVQKTVRQLLHSEDLEDFSEEA